MKTASFFTYTGPGRVSIARWAPRGTPAGFRVYRPLNPTAPMLKMARADYEPLYQAILAKLDPRQVADDLHRLDRSPRAGSALLGTAALHPVELVPSANGCGVV
jgi:hypothetical protein